MLKLIGAQRKPGFADGLVVVFAILAISSLFGETDANVAATAGLLGIVAAFSKLTSGVATALIYGMLGVFGTLAALGHYFSDDMCGLERLTGVGGVVARVATLLAFVAIPIAATITVIRFGNPLAILGMFGLIEAVTFAASPFGVNVFSELGMGPLVAVLFVNVMSVACALQVDLAITFSAVTIGALSVAFDSAGLNCSSSGADYRGVTGVVTYSVVYGLVFATLGRRRR